MTGEFPTQRDSNTENLIASSWSCLGRRKLHNFVPFKTEWAFNIECGMLSCIVSVNNVCSLLGDNLAQHQLFKELLQVTRFKWPGTNSNIVPVMVTGLTCPSFSLVAVYHHYNPNFARLRFALLLQNHHYGINVVRRQFSVGCWTPGVNCVAWHQLILRQRLQHSILDLK